MIIERDGKHDMLVRETLAAIVRRADLTADLVIAFVNKLRPNGPIPRLPKEAWRELGALAQIQVWESRGILQLLERKLPSFSEAIADFADRLEAAARDSNAPLEALLSDLVFKVFVDEIALTGMDDEQADVIVRSNINDTLINELATFVWTHRAELESLINGATSE